MHAPNMRERRAWIPGARDGRAARAANGLDRSEGHEHGPGDAFMKRRS